MCQTWREYRVGLRSNASHTFQTRISVVERSRQREWWKVALESQCTTRQLAPSTESPKVCNVVNLYFKDLYDVRTKRELLSICVF